MSLAKVLTLKFDRVRFCVTTWGLEVLLRLAPLRSEIMRERLPQHDLVAQVKLRDESQGRYFIFKSGKVRSKRGIHPNPDVTMAFENPALARRILRPKRDQLEFLSAAKTFQLEVSGRDALVTWFPRP